MVPLAVATIAIARTRAESRLARPVTTYQCVAVPMPARKAKDCCEMPFGRLAGAGKPAKLRDGPRKSPRSGVHRSARRSNWAFTATTIVLSDIRTAPMAAGSTMPHGANAPAARGIAKMLYPAAHQRF